MNQQPGGPRYLMRWNHALDQRLGRDRLRTTHRLAELSLFSNAGLAGIIDRYPRRAIELITTGLDPCYPSQLQYGRIGRFNGAEVLAMIRRGRFCLRLKDVCRHDRQLGSIVERLAIEMMECQPGLRMTNPEGDLEVSSAKLITYLRYDTTPAIFWQIRGKREFWAYPIREPFVTERGITGAIVSRNQRPAYYEPAMDDHCESTMQCGGAVLALPQFTPYRTINQSLSVLLKTEYATEQSMRNNQVRLANRLLDRVLPRASRSLATSGLSFFAKSALLRLLPGTQNESATFCEPTFQLAEDAEQLMGPLDPSNSTHDPPNASIFPGLEIESGSADHLVSENC